MNRMGDILRIRSDIDPVITKIRRSDAFKRHWCVFFFVNTLMFKSV